MAAISNTQIYKSLQSYWRRKSYQKLESSSMKNNRRVIKLGEGSRRRRNKRSWSIRVPMRSIRTVLRIPSPKKLMLRLRDAYMNAMLVVAGGAQPALKKSSSRAETMLVRRVPRAREVKGGGDFEMRMMMHIYRNLMANPRQLTSCV